MYEPFDISPIESFPERLEALLNQQRDVIRQITESKETSYINVLKPMQDLDESLELFFTPLSH
ncbi:MAG TPA: hypothetical protein ENK72_02320, partial [Epsilonproteobacteria bacterium]|nr:hypothetical protein [Campylobacterota bacterium]